MRAVRVKRTGVVRVSGSEPPFGSQESLGAGAGPGWGSTAGTVEVVRPPVGFLGGAVVAALIGLICAFVGGGEGVWLVGWLVASVGVVSLVSAFVVVDGRRREDSGYSPRPELVRIRWIIVVAGVAIAAVNAFELATEVARRT